MKSVILAGGQGSRLRPLTCDLPKPLVPLCGKPVLEYLFDLLIRNGFDEAVVTLGYLSQQIESRYPDGKYRSLRLSFSHESDPLGTAGSVRRAADGWSEPFIVVSGDAMCDFDLSKIMQFHMASQAEVTVVGFTVDDPRDYGLIERDAAGRIVRFLEKPTWGQATTDLANTGVYVLNPSCLSEIPDGEAFDFATQLFPLLLKQNRPMYCYQADGYWSDVGDVYSYMRTQRDLLHGAVRFPLKKARDGIFVQDTLLTGDFTLIAPVYVGAQVQIGSGAVIGPDTVLESGCTVGRNARVRASVVLERGAVGAGCVMQGALLCADASLHERAAMFERSVAGSGSVIGSGASVSRDVRIWPGKKIDAGAAVRADLQFGSDAAALFDGSGFDESVELTAQICASLGAAICSIPTCRKIAVGYDGTNAAKALLRALEAGALTSGGHVWSFGECFEAQLCYSTAFCGLPIGVYVRSHNHAQIRLCGEGGLSLPRTLEREIETRMRRGEYRRCLSESVRDVADMRSILLMYARELMKQAPAGLRGMEACVQCASSQIMLLMEDTLLRLGCLRSQSLLFHISQDGLQVYAVTPQATVPYERLLALCCKDAFENGMDVAVSYEAPMALDKLAQQYGRKVHRYLSAPADDADTAARRLSAKQIFLRDGLYLVVRTLGILHRRQLSLDALCDELPEFYLERKTFAISFSPSKLHALFGDAEDTTNTVREGITLTREDGRLLILPDHSGKSLHVLAEADKMETAAEMCSGFERLLTELKSETDDMSAG